MNNLLVLVHPVDMNVQNMLSVSIVASTKVNLTFQKNCAENTTRKKMVNFIDANAMKITKVMEKFANYQTPVRLVKMIAHKMPTVFMMKNIKVNLTFQKSSEENTARKIMDKYTAVNAR
jgi:hypothetical protein